MTCSPEDNRLTFLTRRVGELEQRVQALEDEQDRMNRDQMSIIFLCAVATTLCMVFCISLLVI